MSNFEGHPETYTFGKLTMTRDQKGGRYEVTIEGIADPVAAVEPYGRSEWGWVHFETGRSGMVSELPGAGAEIVAIESTRN
jgi:hypothetical protein